jgi:hypothetical protein
MLPGGICGETVKRRTVEREPDMFPPEEDSKPANVHIKGKALKKLSRREDDDDFF